jgi:hypothetical protein
VRVTSAMAAGVTDMPWSLTDMVRIIEDWEAPRFAKRRPAGWANILDGLTAFGLFAVTAMLVCYALENRSHLFILAFAGACAMGSVYGFLQGAWPFGVVETIWTIVALCRWRRARRLQSS